MMKSEFHFRDKIPVAILGATGAVGQRFVELLSHHPWFEIVSLWQPLNALSANPKEAVNWMMPTLCQSLSVPWLWRPCAPGGRGL